MVAWQDLFKIETLDTSDMKVKFESVVLDLLEDGVLEGFGPYDATDVGKMTSKTRNMRVQPKVALPKPLTKKAKANEFPDVIISAHNDNDSKLLIELNSKSSLNQGEIKRMLEFAYKYPEVSFLLFLMPSGTKFKEEQIAFFNEYGIGILEIPFDKDADKAPNYKDVREALSWVVKPRLLLNETNQTLNVDGEDLTKNLDVVDEYKSVLSPLLDEEIGYIVQEDIPKSVPKGYVIDEAPRHDVTSEEKEVKEEKKVEKKKVKKSPKKAEIVSEAKTKKKKVAVASEEIEDMIVEIGEPVLTRFERARIVGARALQLSHGAPTLFTIDDTFDFQPIEVAMKELALRVLPLGIARRLPNGKKHIIIPIQYLHDREFISQMA